MKKKPKFYVGQKVVRTIPYNGAEDTFDYVGGKPAQGKIYTIRELGPHQVTVRLQEVVMKWKVGGGEGWLSTACFKPASVELPPLKPKRVVPYPLP